MKATRMDSRSRLVRAERTDPGPVGSQQDGDPQDSKTGSEVSGIRGFLQRLRTMLPRSRQMPDRWLAREQRRRRYRALALFVAIVAIAAAIWAVLFSSILAVRDVQVVGLSPEAEVAGSSQVIAAAAIDVGTPIARVDAERARSAISDLPWVQSAEVRRAWPDSIVLAVTERTPVAVVESEDPFDPDGEPTRRGVDESGVIFDPPGGLWLSDPVIRGQDAAIPEAVDVVASLPEQIERRVRDVQAVSPDDIRLRLGNDAIVRWGNAQEPDFKAEVLLALLPRRARGYDVSAPQLPTTFRERGPKD